jgi:hypothetical protein
MSPKEPKDKVTEFTIQDRETINETSTMTKEIHGCLFGHPNDPLSGLFHTVNLNTRFRLNMTKLMWVLIPIILSMGLTLIGFVLKH